MTSKTPTYELGDYKLMRLHAGYSYDPRRETAEEGAVRTALRLARAAYALRRDPDLFVVWELDDSEPGEWCCLLCRDADPGERADLIRGYDPRDGIFERPGRVVEALGAVDLATTPTADPYARVIEAELYYELDTRREACLIRGRN